jgi:hypothetical protein
MAQQAIAKKRKVHEDVLARHSDVGVASAAHAAVVCANLH